jgi:hypothetical protein
LEALQLSIRAARKWGILNLSTSFHYDQIKERGKLYIKGVISLEDFLSYSLSNTKVCDATYLKRERKKGYGAKKIKSYIVGCYELLQDVLLTVERYKGVNFIVDFIPLFTTSLNAKPETAIMKYKERAQIEQTNKELKPYLGLEGNHFRTEENNYGHIFILCLVYNFIQYMRRYLTDMGFKDVLEGISVHLLREHPPKCVFSVRNAFEGALGNIGCEKSNKIKIELTGDTRLSGVVAT